jgi:hypothetical protein
MSHHSLHVLYYFIARNSLTLLTVFSFQPLNNSIFRPKILTRHAKYRNERKNQIDKSSINTDESCSRDKY